MHQRIPSAALLLLLVVTGAQPATAQQPQPAQAQQTMNDVLSFLLTNQSVVTGDFVKDQAAANATRDTIARALLVDVATMPLGTSSGGFTYQFNPTLGTLQRRSSTFGPYFVERALGAGANRLSLGLAMQYARFDTLDGNNLRNGQFVTTANQFRDESAPFDQDALTLRLQTSSVVMSARYGIGSRLDVGAMIPFVSLQLDGERTNTYRGQSYLQAVASATRMGFGDLGIQAKYQALGDSGSGFAVAGDVRLPTGRSEDLLGAGRAAVGMLVIGSFESGAMAVHVNGGYSMGGISDELRFGGAVALAATPRLTVDGELFGRRLLDVGRITQVAFPHPTLVGVDTYRLLPTGGSIMPVLAAAGVKWNLAETWVLDAHVLLPVSRAGLTASITPAIALERSFGK
jgi:hypothetical protein